MYTGCARASCILSDIFRVLDFYKGSVPICVSGMYSAILLYLRMIQYPSCFDCNAWFCGCRVVGLHRFLVRPVSMGLMRWRKILFDMPPGFLAECARRSFWFTAKHGDMPQNGFGTTCSCSVVGAFELLAPPLIKKLPNGVQNRRSYEDKAQSIPMFQDKMFLFECAIRELRGMCVIVSKISDRRWRWWIEDT